MVPGAAVSPGDAEKSFARAFALAVCDLSLKRSPFGMPFHKEKDENRHGPEVGRKGLTGEGK
jgi:hypothetical protein